MSFDELKNYVSSQRLSGKNDTEIKAALDEKHWHKDLIEKALKESAIPPEPKLSEERLDTRLLSMSELFRAAWEALTKHLSLYVLAATTTLLAPMLALIVFLAPIIYDIRILHFTTADFFSRSMLPIVVLHAAIGILTIALIAFWSSLALYTIAVHDGMITLRHAFARSWERLPGFAWIGVLSGIIVILGLFVFIIPGIIFSIYLTFASLAYVVHGARGRSALLQSVTLVHGKWWRTFLMVLLPSFVTALIISFAGSILPGIGNFIAQVIVTPFMTIYALILYKNYFAFKKAHEVEAEEDLSALTKALDK